LTSFYFFAILKIIMSTATIKKLIRQEIKKETELLKKEFLNVLRLTYGKDPEGEYRPEFVRRVLKAEKEKSKYTFNSKTFLKLFS